MTVVAYHRSKELIARWVAEECEVAEEEPENDPLAEIADELERTLEAEQKKMTTLESKFNLEL